MNTLIKIAALLPLVAALSAPARDVFEEAPIHYSDTPGDNPITRLQTELDGGDAQLKHDAEFGYLPSLLKLLDVPVSSQLLVFSKTSLQISHISPATPRAIYFNDDVYIGTVQHGEVLEISAADPKLGTAFYTLSQQAGTKPAFVRQRHDCLRCHATGMTRNVPGHIVRSVFAGADGQPIFKAGSQTTDQNTPIEQRWGGWYITGTHGAARHRGNVIAEETEYDAEIDVEAGANLTHLPGRVDPEDYLTPHSDIVAMMVLEHQTRLHNLMTQGSFSVRMALHRQAISDRIFDRNPSNLTESTRRIIKSYGDKIVDYMIFAEEVELDDPVTGTSAFADEFEAMGPRDASGRSLRELDLDERLFNYPLSFLIYAPQFDGLPEPLKEYVYQRLWNILTGEEPTPDLLHLTKRKCRAVIEIVADTKEGLPSYWVK